MLTLLMTNIFRLINAMDKLLTSTGKKLFYGIEFNLYFPFDGSVTLQSYGENVRANSPELDPF